LNTATTPGGFQPNSTNIVGGLRSVTLWGADSASLLALAALCRRSSAG